MTRYVAFLRAINVGGHTVKMAHLQKLFEELGFSNVETFIASGNVIFEAAAKNAASLERKIAEHLERSLGFAVDTFLRTMPEVAEIEMRSPFRADRKDKDVYVAFMHETPAAEAIAALMALKNSFNDFAVLGREVYWLRLNKDASIFLRNSLEKILQTSSTTRNVTTVKKISEKYRS